MTASRVGGRYDEAMLAPMSEPEYAEYIERSVARYAEALARAGVMDVAAALQSARTHMEALLPDGRLTTGHHFMNLVRGGDVVGTLWFHEQLDESPPRLFVFDVRVRPESQGAGVGTAAMEALEAEARRSGVSQLMLSVFFHNAGAIRLYERLGFEECERSEAGMRMRKSV